jgi:riboflavin synthase alpha subunit
MSWLGLIEKIKKNESSSNFMISKNPNYSSNVIEKGMIMLKGKKITLEHRI